MNQDFRAPQALAALEGAISADPVAEELYRRLMRLQGKLGRPDAVRRTYRLLARRLAELDAGPRPGDRAAGGRAAAPARRLTRFLVGLTGAPTGPVGFPGERPRPRPWPVGIEIATEGSPGGVAVREARSALDAACETSARPPSQLHRRAHLLRREAPAKPSKTGALLSKDTKRERLMRPWRAWET